MSSKIPPPDMWRLSGCDLGSVYLSMTRFAQVKTGEVWAPLLSLSSRSPEDR